ncbi:MAG: ABC transporter permease [Pseudomonadota bacterium]
MTGTLVFILGGMLAAATPILLAALGEAVAERSGVLNLSVEGMMATGAAFAFATASLTGSHLLGFAAAGAAAMVLAAIFSGLVLVFLANQVAAGLAVGILGLGVSALAGRAYEGRTYEKVGDIDWPLADIPILGPILFGHDIVVYLGLVMVVVVSLVLARTKLGLRIRAVGEDPAAAHANGIPVQAIRFGCVLFGGLMAGLGGAYLALGLTGLWAEGLIAGRGWIAVALVVFGAWVPWRILAGAYVFGAIALMELSVQGFGLNVPSQLLSASPYLVTILVLALISRDPARLRRTRPLSLGQTYDSH